MTRLGDTLRAQRERRGITLDQAAADTRIREKFLKALEDSDYRALPGTVYTKGFLRNYAEYLSLDSDELVALLHQERDGTPEPPRTFQPIRPLARRSLIFTPAVLVPVVVIGLIVLFVGYLYYQFTTFAVAPPLEITDPASSAVIAQDATYTLKGRTVPSGRLNVEVNPGSQTFEVRPLSDGTFNITITLTPGANHVLVQVFDQSGKVTQKTLTITLPTASASPSANPQALTVSEPSDGGTYTNIVPVTGSYDASITALTVGGVPVSVNTAHRFDLRLTLAAGSQTIHVVATTSAGTVEQTRTVTVRFDEAVVNVLITGGDAWLLATVDGKDVPGTGRVFKAGEAAQYIGKEVVLRTGNAAATLVSYDGEAASTLGTTGAVVEKVYRAP